MRFDAVQPTLQIAIVAVLAGGTLLFAVVKLARYAQQLNRRRAATNELLWNQRLQNPDWAYFEDYYRCEVPGELRWLFDESGVITQRNVRLSGVKPTESKRNSWFIGYFLPADRAGIDERYRLPLDICDHCFALAVPREGDIGLYYFVDLSRDNEPLTPLFLQLNECQNQVVAGSLRTVFQQV